MSISRVCGLTCKIGLVVRDTSLPVESYSSLNLYGELLGGISAFKKVRETKKAIDSLKTELGVGDLSKNHRPTTSSGLSQQVMDLYELLRNESDPSLFKFARTLSRIEDLHAIFKENPFLSDSKKEKLKKY
jgi:hypothetical protein